MALLLFIIFALNLAQSLEISKPYVVQGTETATDAYKYTVNVRIDQRVPSHCGGTLIAPRYVLTAAHCQDIANAINIKYAVIGSHTNSKYERSHNLYEVGRVIVHSLWNPDALQYDFAILELTQSVKHITPVLLGGIDDAQFEFSGQTASIHGWGATTSNGEIPSEVLREADVHLIPNYKCNQAIVKIIEERENITAPEGTSVISTANLCSQSIAGESTCFGDSGGPLVLHKDAARPTLIGTVSWGIACGQPSYPYVFA